MTTKPLNYSDATSEWGKFGQECEKITSLVAISSYFNRIAASMLFSDYNPTEPLHLLDIAGGTGLFITATAEHFKKSAIVVLPGSSLTTTDSAEGMVKVAKTNIESIDFASIGEPKVEYMVLDACDCNCSLLSNHYYTHISCICGIMFFSQRSEALRQMHQKLQPHNGHAVITTWQSTGLEQLCFQFCVFIDSTLFEWLKTRKSPTDIGKDPNELRQELVNAGFLSVTVHSHSVDFEISEESIFTLITSNPPILTAFPAFAMTANRSIEALRSLWLEFLNTPENRQQWFDFKNSYLRLHYIANIAICTQS